MKNLILTVTAMMLVAVVFGQTNKRTSAFNYNNYGKLDLAKEAIDEAAQHEKTIMDAKTWFYRGNIYYNIGVSLDSNYRKLDPDPFGVSLKSYLKAKELDVKGEFKENIDQNIVVISQGYFNMGVFYYNEQNYPLAAKNFEQAYEVSKIANQLDTTALFNAAISARDAHDRATAKKYYLEIIKMNVSNPVVYDSLANIYKAEGDTAIALQTIQQGRQVFKEDLNLVIAETNIYLQTNQQDKALANLETAAKLDPTNPTVFWASGTIYDQLGEQDKAIKAYETAIQLKPDYFVAYFNLGILYFNQATEVMAKANDLPYDTPQDVYDAEKAKAKEIYLKSVPYLEKSFELEPGDMDAANSLRAVYGVLEMADKLKALNESINK
ncbi:MAG TPA: tetratricopeptide repeat protein [Bacteroidales bacterium]|nr:tetratricopeptide repeat protein [Bacteroidales bacterium]HPM93803.1 tetratricopeptide repeat protein [Bacteroidales bacterium]